ncbi:MAG: DNA repair protein RadA [Candidatus Shapirobacteria bacterium]|jgi:DNA repair protein RadA/Sms
MKKTNEVVFVCSNCGNEFGKWSGQCSACGEWNTLKEVKSLKVESRKGKRLNQKRERTQVVNLGKLNLPLAPPLTKGGEGIYISAGISEFDRVLGKGFVRGQVILFAGEPGIGKSTLLTQLMGNVSGLYVAGEESAEQIALRVERLRLDTKKFDILETNSADEVIEFLERAKNVYKIVVVDSIQVMLTEGAASVAGSPGQIKEVTFRLVEVAKKLGVTIIIVGHVTKEGDIAGPKMLEHMVDTVLYFEGDKNSELRILRVTKNRFGPTDEVGVFKMEERGLREIRSDEINLVSGGGAAKIGSAVTVIMEGTRPILVEIQALVVESFAPMPKRVFSGIDYNRGQLLIAVAQKILAMPLYKYDVFVSVTGGIKIDDTGSDIAILAAMWSSYKNLPLKRNPSSNPPFDKGGRGALVFIGEVSLLGEVKKVRNWERRIKEAKSLGWEAGEVDGVRDLKLLV